MDAREVIKAVKFIKDSCAVTSCDYCDFCDKDNNCVLADELIGAPSEIEIEILEQCIESEE